MAVNAAPATTSSYGVQRVVPPGWVIYKKEARDESKSSCASWKKLSYGALQVATQSSRNILASLAHSIMVPPAAMHSR